MHQVLITALAIAGTPRQKFKFSINLQRLKEHQPDRTFYKEAMKYTYQDFTKEEFTFLKLL